MDNYLVDRQVLEQVVDAFIKEKPLPVDNTEELANLRENLIKILNDKISRAIFEQLSDEQLVEIGKMLDDQETSPEAFQEFFDKANVDLEKVIADTMLNFKNKFLEGEYYG